MLPAPFSTFTFTITNAMSINGLWQLVDMQENTSHCMDLQFSKVFWRIKAVREASDLALIVADGSIEQVHVAVTPKILGSRRCLLAVLDSVSHPSPSLCSMGLSDRCRSVTRLCMGLNTGRRGIRRRCLTALRSRGSRHMRRQRRSLPGYRERGL